jgi:Response regulator containing a CheY-like receiver domain and an HTH DNA-binding domain
VARLAAQGLTNAEIADELYISVVTVKRHLANIFGKTGIASRKDQSAVVFPSDKKNENFRKMLWWYLKLRV